MTEQFLFLKTCLDDEDPLQNEPPQSGSLSDEDATRAQLNGHKRAIDDIRLYAQQAEFQLGCITAFLNSDALKQQVPRDMQGHLEAASGMCRSLDSLLNDIRMTASTDGQTSYANAGMLAMAHASIVPPSKSS